MFYETCEYITFADKLRMLRWRDYAGIQEAQYNDREEGGWREGKTLFHCLWRWKKEPQGKEYRYSLAARESKETDSSLEPLERAQPCGPTHFQLLTSRTVR